MLLDFYFQNLICANGLNPSINFKGFTLIIQNTACYLKVILLLEFIITRFR